FPRRHSILSVVPETSDQVDVLFRLQNEMGIDFWSEAGVPGSTAVVRVAPKQLSMFTKKISEAGMTAKTEVQNVQELIDEERDGAQSTTFSSTPLRFRRYLTNAEFEIALKSYGLEYDHVHYSPIGKSYEGRDIIGVHITKGTNRPIMFFECGIHAREWVAHATCLYIIDQLATMYKKDETVKRLVDEYEWRIHPVVNPDGYAYTHTIRSRISRHPSNWLKAAVELAHSLTKTQNMLGRLNKRRGQRGIDSEFKLPLLDLSVLLGIKVSQFRFAYFFLFFSNSVLSWSRNSNTWPAWPIHKRHSPHSTDGSSVLSPSKRSQARHVVLADAVTGSSVDWAYEKAGVAKSFALELQPGSTSSDSSKGLLLPPKYILPTAEETWAGIRAAIGSP
ncbi:unnamed protein product, partial [Ixodes pacificus]